MFQLWRACFDLSFKLWSVSTQFILHIAWNWALLTLVYCWNFCSMMYWICLRMFVSILWNRSSWAWDPLFSSCQYAFIVTRLVQLLAFQLHSQWDPNFFRNWSSPVWIPLYLCFLIINFVNQAVDVKILVPIGSMIDTYQS